MRNKEGEADRDGEEWKIKREWELRKWEVREWESEIKKRKARSRKREERREESDDDNELLAGGGFMTPTAAVRQRQRQRLMLSYIPTRGGQSRQRRHKAKLPTVRTASERRRHKLKLPTVRTASNDRMTREQLKRRYGRRRSRVDNQSTKRKSVNDTTKDFNWMEQFHMNHRSTDEGESERRRWMLSEGNESSRKWINGNESWWRLREWQAEIESEINQRRRNPLGEVGMQMAA